ncbi:MAG: aspartate kinase [Planctomycetota bacterium]
MNRDTTAATAAAAGQSAPGAAIWVQKYGGTSVATPELIKAAAQRIRRQRERGKRMVVVVSAMGKTTDTLMSLARSISATPPKRELDVLLSAGEVQSMALLVIALNELQIPAISFTGQQGGIRTDSRHSDARIQAVESARIERELDAGRVVVVAGFQGVAENEDITTLGRGGSDTSAVALAAALGAERCEILTDVDGVYTADPRVVKNARRIEMISYDEMLEMASHGAQVLHGRSVEVARRYHVPLTVASATKDTPGTRIGNYEEGEEPMESVVVRAVTEDADVRKVSVVKVPDRPGIAARLFSVLGEEGVNIRLIVQAQSHDNTNDITFIVPAETALPDDVLNKAVAAVGGESYIVDDEVGLLSVVGEGIAREPGVAGKVFAILAESGVNIDLISTSNLYITCVVPIAQLKEGAKALHAGLIEVG